MKINIDLLIDKFVKESIALLNDNLVGIYLHGSLVMKCFNPNKSDIDLLVVIMDEIPDDTKHQYMDMLIRLNEDSPAKGIELSIVNESVCKPFIYPTPFELHFSVMHLDWYKSYPDDYVKKMKGVDKDLAAHIAVINHRGRALYGKEINEVFSEVVEIDYLDSILGDIKEAEEDILVNPMYIILTMCRVLAYKMDNLILSKKEGGRWGLANVPEHFHYLIKIALQEYETEEDMEYSKVLSVEYAISMKKLIEAAKRRELDFSNVIGRDVSGHIDRSLNSFHPTHPDMIYPINYGYVDGIYARDGAEQDVYVFGIDEPIEYYTGKVIAVFHRFDDVEDKWIVSLNGQDFSDKKILDDIYFQEQYFIGKLFR